MMNRFEARVERVRPRDSCVWLRLPRGQRLASKLWTGIQAGQKVTVAIPPEDVVLCEGHPGVTSARNVLPGHVRSVRQVPEGSLVTLDVGFPLVALVTHRSVEDLQLRAGRALFALVKAVAVTRDISIDAPFRVCPVGEKGPLLPKEVDFIRSIALAGSLTAAARELGLHYGTAWMRARAVNRSWGRPLVARARGGQGGGGAALTPEGQALLQYVARLEAARVASR